MLVATDDISLVEPSLDSCDLVDGSVILFKKNIHAPVDTHETVAEIGLLLTQAHK